MWTFAPDNRIQEHLARFGTADGEWTAASGWREYGTTDLGGTPLDLTTRMGGHQLTADEFALVRRILDEAGRTGPSVRFPVVALDEPDKAAVLAAS